jgi:hypothetical protein
MTDITDTDRLEFIQNEAEGNGFEAKLRHTTYAAEGSTVHTHIRSEWSVNGRTWHPTFREALDEAIKLALQ